MMFLEFIIFFICTVLFIFILFCAAILLSTKVNSNLSKFELYECGFKVFENARQPINIEFFLIGILFIIFDLETIYILPWLLYAKVLGPYSLFLMLTFIIILVLGYIYEYIEGFFDWNYFLTI